ncbi:MAG: DNA repair protein RecO [Chloroflexia bacterium]
MTEARQRLYQTEGIILRRSDVGEADRILTLYTPERGKIRLLAKGVRRPGSRLAGHVELLAHSAFLVARGRNLDIVTQAQTRQAFPALRQDLERIGWGCYIAELLDRMAPEQEENYPAYLLLLEALELLDRGGNGEMVARSFEMHLLGYMGYRPQLFRCVSCEVGLEERPPAFSIAQGGVLCPRCREQDPRARPLSLEGWKVLRYLQSAGLSEAECLALSDERRREVADLLYAYIRSVLERDLNAVGFLEALRQEGKGRR